MTDHAADGLDRAIALLHNQDLDLVTGGQPGYPGLPPGAVLNISVFANADYDLAWEIVGATGTLGTSGTPIR